MDRIFYALIIILIIIIVCCCVLFTEGMYPFYLDQMAMKNEDPMYFKYMGRKRDVLGMSGRDYYLENQMMAKNEVQSYFHDNNPAQFSNVHDYISMDKTYRPRSPVRDVVLSDLD